MILITKVEWEKVTENSVTRSRIVNPPKEVLADIGKVPETTAEYITEKIDGVRFKRPDGEEVVIGNMADPSDVIGIQYELWKSMENNIRELDKELLEAEAIIERIANYGFFKRLRIWLFGFNKKDFVYKGVSGGC